MANDFNCSLFILYLGLRILYSKYHKTYTQTETCKLKEKKQHYQILIKFQTATFKRYLSWTN